MKFLTPSIILSAIVGAEEIISPLFLLSSTASLDLTAIPDYSSVNDIHQAFSHAVSSCPTKNYAVVHQSGVSIADYDSSYLPIGVHAHTNLVVEKIRGDVDIVGVVNTILMDCLHATDGVRRVESLDTSKLEVSYVAQELIKKSIVHISLPDIPCQLDQTERAAFLARHDAYMKEVVSKHFDNKDYTLIYITKAAANVVQSNTEDQVDDLKALDGAEIPFVFEDES